MGGYDGKIGDNPIEWTETTWNPVTGCDKVSAGCKFCYAEPMAERLQKMNPVGRYKNGFKLTLHPDLIDQPRTWKKGRFVFVNSMSDLLHKDVPDDFLLKLFRVMAETPRHTYQILTKRPERWGRITEMVDGYLGGWPLNVWPGTSVENRKAMSRLIELRDAGWTTTGVTRMVSMEPLLEDLGPAGQIAEDLVSANIGWVITGGESGPHARPAHLDWFRNVRDACAGAMIPYFHKQHGGNGRGKEGKGGGKNAELDGVIHHAMPPVRVQSIAGDALTR